MDGSGSIHSGALRAAQVAIEQPEPDLDLAGTGISISLESRAGRGDRWRVRRRETETGIDESKWFATPEQANKFARGLIALQRIVGITLEEWGELFLEDHGYSNAVRATWKALVSKAPFFKQPIATIVSDQIAAWACDLVTTFATRSELRDGVRTLVTLDYYIDRNYAKSALSAVRTCLEAAKNRKPQLISVNPAKEVRLPPARDKNGKVRTKKKKRSKTLEYLPHLDCQKIFFCAECGAVPAVGETPEVVLERLVVCPHVPFFYRVALSVSVMQGLRQGELASQRWERIRWVNSDDWTGHSWRIETSWEDDETKNGQHRPQALIPMAARLLHRWWEFKGCPESGLLFCTSDATAKRELGPLAKFVAEHPTLPNKVVVSEAKRQGITITLHRVETLRSEGRARQERKLAQRDKMFAKNYDFAWFDTDYRDADKVLQRRPGWRTKLRISNPEATFHDHRDTAATHLLSGTWGEPWSMKMVSEFIGHSDTKVTEQRYAQLTDAAKTKAAAGVDPSRFVAAPLHPRQLVRFLSAQVGDVNALSAGNQWAPEAGLEPTTNRLTAYCSPKESAPLAQKSCPPRTGAGESGTAAAAADGCNDDEAVRSARRVLEAAANGGSLLAAALQLAGAVLEKSERRQAAAPGLRLVTTPAVGRPSA